MKNKKIISLISLALIAMIWTGCEKDYNYVAPKGNGDKGTGGVVDSVHFKTVIEPIFANNGCAKSGCHQGSNLPLDLTTGNAYSSLFANGNINLGSPENSDLYVRVNLPPSNSEFMPEGGSPLSSTDISNILEWINQGAQNN